jgi:hypothetical protein
VALLLAHCAMRAVLGTVLCTPRGRATPRCAAEAGAAAPSHQVSSAFASKGRLRCATAC